MDDIIVSLMTEADIDGAIDTIQQAFADDPYNNWVFDKSKFSPTRNHASLRLRCEWGIRHALFYVACSRFNPSEILGTAMWLPPKPAVALQTWSEYFGSWWLWLGQIRMNLTYGRGGLNTRRYWIWKSRQAEAQKDIWFGWDKGCYFCNIVTVLPEAQGRGVGRKLMEEVLAKADKEGLPCYLESSRREPNVAIYEKFGFRLAKEMNCRDGEAEGGSVMLYCMVRDPGGSRPGNSTA